MNVGVYHIMNKRKLLISSIVVIPFLLVVIYFLFYKSFKEVIHADLSINPRATNYFAHAMLINMGEMLVHDFLFIDYDSFLFKPLHAIQDHLFTEGQKYVAEDNLAEEGVWWSLIHLNKYGLVKSGRKDRSFIKKELSNKDSLPMREQALKYFYAVIDEGVKGVDFGNKEFSAAFGLFVFPFYKVSFTYPGKTRDDQIDNYWADHSLYLKALSSYEKYKAFLESEPELRSKLFGPLSSSIVGRLNYLLYFNTLNSHQDSACGLLLDDYLVILSSSALDMKEFDPVRIKVVNATLEHLNKMCTTREADIQKAQKYFLSME